MSAVTVTLRPANYYALQQGWTSEAERAFLHSRAIELPDGRLQFALPEFVQDALRQFMLPGEDFDRFDEVVERMMAVASGSVH